MSQVLLKLLFLCLSLWTVSLREGTESLTRWDLPEPSLADILKLQVLSPTGSKNSQNLALWFSKPNNIGICLPYVGSLYEGLFLAPFYAYGVPPSCGQT